MAVRDERPLQEDQRRIDKTWDIFLHTRVGAMVAYGPAVFFSAPYALVIGHNWFRDADFDSELRRIALDRFIQARKSTQQSVEAHPPDALRGSFLEILFNDPGWLAFR